MTQWSADCLDCTWNVSTNDSNMYDHMCAQHVNRYDHRILGVPQNAA